jgi:HlyD family secretion protein
MKKKIYLISGIALVLVIIGFLVVPALNGSRQDGQNQGSYQTEPAKKGSLSVSIGGTGNVQAKQSAVLLWQTKGKVAKVNVQKGQQVKADAILSELEPTSLAQNVLQAQVDLINAQEELDKAINNSEARADTHLALIQAQQALDDAEKESKSKLYQRASQETIDIARANLITANDALDTAEGVWERTRNAPEDSVIYAAGLSDYARARQEQRQADYNLRYVEGLPDPLTVEEANIKLDQAKAQLLTAKQNWEKVKDGPDENEVLAAQVKIDMAQATLDQARLIAPFAGTITEVNSQTGDLVSSGEQGFQVDDLSSIFVDVDISEVDINQVQIEQSVTITFDAIPEEEYSGFVTDISSVGSSNNGTVDFTVTVEIQNPSAVIKPGMTAVVNITVNQLEDVLLVPSRAVRTVNGKRVVYVLKDNQPVAVEISLGASANNYSQITSGDLKPGNLIILNPSTNVIPMGTSGGLPGGGQ